MTALQARIGALDRLPARLAPFGCGGAMALAQPPLSLWFVLFLALPPLVWLLDRARGAGGGFGVGWFAGLGYFAVGLFWIVDPFLVDPGRHGWMAPFALAGMAGGLALFWGAAFAIARLLWTPGAWRVATLAAVWTLAEIARAHLLTGFPWALVAYSWIDTPVSQALALVGPHGLSFLTLLAAMLPAARLGRMDQAGAMALAAALLLVAWGHGALRLAAPYPERAEPLVVRLVQPNAAQRLKWLPDMQMEFYQRHLALTRAPADPSPDVVIWSETAVPFVLGYADALQAEVAAAAPQATIILGIQRVEADAEGERWFNSLAALNPDGSPSAVYDKHRLVPFGEYIPLAGLVARLGIERLTTLTARGFTPGPGPQIEIVPNLPPFLPLICYEAIFPNVMDARGGRPDWIVQVTNDAWFGEISGPYQHLAQARARAIEQGLPLARSANTGVSAMIDARGRITGSIPLGEIGYVDTTLPSSLTLTTYAKLGETPLYIALASILMLTVTAFRSSLSSRPRE